MSKSFLDLIGSFRETKYQRGNTKPISLLPVPESTKRYISSKEESIGRQKMDYRMSVRNQFFNNRKRLTDNRQVLDNTRELQQDLEVKVLNQVTAIVDRAADNAAAIIDQINDIIVSSDELDLTEYRETKEPEFYRVNSPTAVFWIAESAGSKYYSTKYTVEMFVHRWLKEVHGPLAQIDRQAKELYSNPTHQSIYFIIRVLYYLVFGLYRDSDIAQMTDEDWGKVEQQCPYDIAGKNFMIALIESRRCLCVCYNSYMMAAAQEFGYYQIQPCTYSYTHLWGHVFPIVEEHGTIVLAVDPGFFHNNYLRLRNFTSDRKLQSVIVEIVDQLRFTIIYYEHDVIIKTIQQVYNNGMAAQQPLDLIRHETWKNPSSFDNVIDMVFVALDVFNITELSNFRDILIGYMADRMLKSLSNDELEKIVLRNPATRAWEADKARFMDATGVYDMGRVGDLPDILTNGYLLYLRLQEPIRLVSSNDRFEEKLLLPWYYRTFFIFLNTGEERSLLTYTGVVDPESGLVIGDRPQAAPINIPADVDYPTPELLLSIDANIEDTFDNITKNDFDVIEYDIRSHEARGIFIPTEILSYIQNRIRDQFDEKFG